MRTIISDIKRSIISRNFITSLIAGIIIFFAGAMTKLVYFINFYRYSGPQIEVFNNIFNDAIYSDAILLCVPIISAIPFTASFVDDMKSGFIKHFLSRSTFRGYSLGKIIASALSGGIALSGSIAIGTGLLRLITAPIEQYMPDYISAFSVKILIIFFLSGMLWSLVGLMMSSITMNKYMAYASPFIIYYVFVILAERYFRTVYVLNPQNYITMTGNWDLGEKSIYIALALFIIGISLIFYIISQKRLRN